MGFRPGPPGINANLKPTFWPEVDQAAWASAGRNGRSPFRKDGGGRERSPHSVVTVRNSYGRFISYLKHAYPELLEFPPCERLLLDVLDDYFGHLQEIGNADYTVIAYFDGLRRAMNWMFPRISFKFVTSPGGVSLTSCLPMACKPRLVPHTAVLLACARQLFESAASRRTRPQRRAQVRDAVEIGLLATMGPRVRALSLLELGRHVRHIEGEWIIEQTPDITKTGRRTGRSQIMPVEPEVGTWLTRYVEVERDEMMAPSSTATTRLFVNKFGCPMSREAMSTHVGKRTKQALGIAIRPQAFRSALATTEAIEGSDHPMDASTILGHTSPMMTLAHYNRANGMAASRRHSKRLKDMRKRLADAMPPSSRS